MFSRSTYFKTIASVFLLLVFVLGVTPKRFLHTAFATHTDSRSQHTDNPYQFNKSGYNCDCDNIVAESPFEGTTQHFENFIPQGYSEYLVKETSFSSNITFSSYLRGPPVKI